MHGTLVQGQLLPFLRIIYISINNPRKEWMDIKLSDISVYTYIYIICLYIFLTTWKFVLSCE